MVCHTHFKHSSEKGGPDISLLDQALQLHWDYEANAHLGNIVIKPYSHLKVQWKCDKCPDSHPHAWHSAVSNRTTGTRCPQCTGRKVCQHNSLATRAPVVAADWDHKANAHLGTPDTVLAQSHKPAHWRCHKCGHQWVTKISLRTNTNTTSGCPMCAPKRTAARRPTFADSQHPVLAEWDHERNAAHGNFPHNTTEGSSKNICWLCSKCPAGQVHSWIATPDLRTGKFQTGCPVCAGQVACECNSLQACYPSIAADWDFSKNPGQPADYPASCTQMAWWCTAERGSWQQSISGRTSVVQQKLARARRVQQRQFAVQQE